jgi:hypothetical protein
VCVFKDLYSKKDMNLVRLIFIFLALQRFHLSPYVVEHRNGIYFYARCLICLKCFITAHIPLFTMSYILEVINYPNFVVGDLPLMKFHFLYIKLHAFLYIEWNNNIVMEFSVHDTFLEYPLSGKLHFKRLESQII